MPDTARTIVGRVLVAVGLLVGLLGAVGPGSWSAAAESVPAQSDAPDSPAPTTSSFVDVVKVSGLLDPVLTDFLEQSVRDAAAAGATSLVLQVNSSGSVISDAAFSSLLDTIATSTVPVDIWVGPSGSRLTGRPAQLVGVARQLGMAPGTDLGDAGSFDNPYLDQARLDLIRDRTLGAQEARDLGVTNFDAPTIGDFVVNLPGFETRQVAQGDQTRREPVTQVRFSQLSLTSQLMHTVASPAVAYLLLTLGLALIVFELFTAGVGVAGVVGAGSLVLGCYGLAVLPTNWWGIALIVVSMAAFSVDVQTGVPRFWTGAGVVLYVAGALTLYQGVSLSWVTLLFGIVGVLLAFLMGMPSMVRTRFSTPTIGREWLIGEAGRAVTPINPDGVVQIRDALWRAYTKPNRSIDELDRVRVTGTDGLVLEVEPDDGEARAPASTDGQSESS